MTQGQEPNILNVFRDQQLIGQFARSDSGHVAFAYSPDAPNSPISLSLPRDGSHARNAPGHFLNNLLPDNKHIRSRWARALGVPDTPFDLLSRMGEDVAGALVLTPADELPEFEPATAVTRLASDDEIAERILAIQHDPNASFSVEQLGRARMSLAGAQGKFALARIGDQWLWSSAEVPSTHIFKPGNADLRDVISLEVGSLKLARHASIDAPTAQILTFCGQHTYAVERFDRSLNPHGVARREHIEDITQALSLGPKDKYHVTAKQVITLLRKHAVPDEAYTFIRMLAFNTMIDNVDAHAKNYSLRLDGPVRLTPLYDALPTTLWPTQLDAIDLAMRISGARQSPAVSQSHWSKLARTTDLDEDRVQTIVREVADVVANRAHDTYRAAGVSQRTLHDLDARLHATTQKLLSAYPAATSRNIRNQKTFEQLAERITTLKSQADNKTVAMTVHRDDGLDAHVTMRGYWQLVEDSHRKISEIASKELAAGWTADAEQTFSEGIEVIDEQIQTGLSMQKEPDGPSLG